MHADLVEQQTTTTGTSDYVVSGAVAGRRTFAQGYPANDPAVPYVVTDDAGNWEVGIGAWTVTTPALTLARTKVFGSSNGGLAVAWAAGTKRIYVAPNAAMQAVVPGKHTLNGTDGYVPGNSNNASQGYVLGSTWQTQGTSGFVRKYVLNTFAGASALWSELAQIINPGTQANELAFGQVRLQGDNLWLHSNNQPQGYVGLGMSTGRILDGAVYNSSDAFVTGASIYTTNATATKMALDGDVATNDAINLYNGSVVTFKALVTARRDNGDRKCWEVTCVASCASGVVTIDLNTATVLFASAGAAAWALTCVALSTYGVALQATGAAASKIAWSAVITGSYVNQA